MSVSSKLTERSQELVQEEIIGAALATALDSKTSAKAEGLTGRMPRQHGAMIRTPTRLLFLKIKKISGKPVEVVTGWTDDQIASITYRPPDSGSCPGVTIESTDGTDLTVYGEKNCGLETLA